MRQMFDPVWKVRGTSWIWDDEARNLVAQTSEVWSLRQLLQAVGRWPHALPSNGDRALVVAGLDGSLDLLEPVEGEAWLREVMKPAILSFQDEYQGEAALVFWLPSGHARIKPQPATDAVQWICAAPYGQRHLDLGRILWGEANEYPQEIVLRDGGRSVGLFHLRIT